MNFKTLGDRMKWYENTSKDYLTNKIPAIIRLDGKAFHTFTREMRKPFDDILIASMQSTMQYLCKNIQGCVFGYTQSDEITLVLTDYKTPTTDAWFNYNVQKMTSISANMATLYFNIFFDTFAEDYSRKLPYRLPDDMPEKDRRYLMLLQQKKNKAMFDSRVFSVPKEEVCNCLIWRQQDAIRNSIQAVGQANFSQKTLQGKSCNEIKEILLTEKDLSWEELPTHYKYGSCCYKIIDKKVYQGFDGQEAVVNRGTWIIDQDIPIFTQDRLYVDKWL